MLKSLEIQNFALIDTLNMQPAPGLNTITGETGAGKSIMLGAIQLLLGHRADSKVLLDENRKCVVEAVFEIKNLRLESRFSDLDLDYTDEVIIRREIAPGGKSRAFINDTPVNLEGLKSITLSLLDIHAQHETLSIGTSESQLNLLDQLLSDSAVLENYKTAYQNWKTAQTNYSKLIELKTKSLQDLDYKQFIYKELVDADLDQINQEALEDELSTLENAEQIKIKLNELTHLLDQGEYAAVGILAAGIQSLQQLKKLSNSFAPLYQRLENLWIELKDICSEIEKLESHTDPDQEAMLSIKDRLSVLYKLYQKHGTVHVQELIALRNTLEEEVSSAENLDANILEAEQILINALDKCKTAGRALHEKRVTAYKFFSEKISPLFPQVGMPNAKLDLLWIEKENPHSTGLDEVSLLFSANKGIEPAPIKQVASGGEFSRLMLCVKCVLAEKIELPTLIFDEIDSGISGEIALQVAELIKKISLKHQVLSITHLPQMAAAGDAHFFVYKDENKATAISSIRKLDKDERLLHLAAMIGGNNPSSSALQSAKELLKRHQQIH